MPMAAGSLPVDEQNMAGWKHSTYRDGTCSYHPFGVGGLER
jgi:hypothetical protein